MKVAIYSRGIDASQERSCSLLLQELRVHKAELLIWHLLANTLQHSNLLYGLQFEVFDHHDALDGSVDCLISMGGDGTMLDAATLIRDKAIPLLGINFGRLGFLATIGRDEMHHAVESLVSRTYHIDQRTLLHVDGNIPLFEDAPFAINELVVHKSEVSSMIKVHCYINGEFLNTYWCDGLIVSTPTGSTGYNLSCNGPIIFPDSGSFAITPIAPHHLNVRPIVVPDKDIISFEVESRSDKFICSIDARRQLVDVNTQVAVKKEDFTIGLMRLNENTFLETLRTKLTWGMDKRN
ncbi:MAG TPA: NAD kinase [Phnomibacter sp.]|nr:NAD kinase [Phnomibacter sp.]